ncbi:MAG: hypothetical protein KC563_13970, partial [Nitrospira sp.]|nr:hypothetical protein [Nitrospira sp.]
MANPEEKVPNEHLLLSPLEVDREQLLAAHRNWKRNQLSPASTDGSSAFSPSSEVQEPAENPHPPGRDFFQLDRREADFRHQDLRNANFQEAYLPG